MICEWYRQFFFNLFILLFYLFIVSGCVGSSSLRAGSSPVAASGGHSSLRCAGLSPRRPPPLRSTGSRRAGPSSRGSRAPERRLSSCGARTQLLHGMWDPPGPGLEPMSPTLAGGLPTTAPPGKPQTSFKGLYWEEMYF